MGFLTARAFLLRNYDPKPPENHYSWEDEEAEDTFDDPTMPGT